MLMRFAAAVLACGLVAGHAAAQEGRLEPVDEGAADPSWIRFRASLLNAIDKKDRTFIRGMVDPQVRNGQGHRDGITEFRRQWELDTDPKALWVELRRIVTLGGVFVKPEKGPPEYCTPYVALRWPENFERFGGGALIARDVLVKEAPTAEAETLATLSYEIIEVKDWEVDDKDPKSPQKWVQVVLKAGGTGYVPEEQIRSPVEHRACFRRTAEGWKLTALLAGE